MGVINMFDNTVGLVSGLPLTIQEFYLDEARSEPTGETIEEDYIYTDEEGEEQIGSRLVDEYEDVNYIVKKATGEIKAQADLDRVVALGKPQFVIDKFTECVNNGIAWGFHDEYIQYLTDMEEWSSWEPIQEFDEEGEALPLPTQPDAPNEPVRGSDVVLNYADLRKAEYPPLEDFADAYVKAQLGDSSELDEYVAMCNDIKVKYPKGE